MAMRTSTDSVGDAVQDRQRARTARGVGGRAAPAGARPTPPRRRRPAVALLGVLLILGGAALAGLLALRMDSREPVLVVKSDIPAGTKLTVDMLGETNVATESDLIVPAGAIRTVEGTYTRVPLNEGQLLDTSMLVRTNPLSGGQLAEVGVPLVEGRVPDDLDSGDLVRIVRIGEGDRPSQPLALGLVIRPPVSSSGGGVLGGGSDSEGSAATLLVPLEVADAIVDAAGNNRIGMSLVDRGVAVTDTDRLRSLAGATR
ncbi:SAF domain-containing protein [Aeromicrobium sp. Marseille-Q0843]|uniref:SAF domain-containing protein n=1 Tax=Aeromicrobium phoceense TaxID=2754045 RepID=A0A838XNY5_9ACTN|nr:SAF domain-containing protein [Aeromicrobium phoceense]MBA4608570.1 SAF domain-containing protein [Aeromicrobium phoceense]